VVDWNICNHNEKWFLTLPAAGKRRRQGKQHNFHVLGFLFWFGAAKLFTLIVAFAAAAAVWMFDSKRYNEHSQQQQLSLHNKCHSAVPRNFSFLKRPAN